MTSKVFVEHSQIRLKNTISKIQSGIWGEEPDGIRDVICLRVADFNRDNFTIDDAKLTLRAVDIKDKLPRLLKKGDLLIEKSGGGDNQPVGTVAYFDKDYEAITSNFLSYLRPSRIVDGRFLCYLFASLYSSRINTKSIKQTTGIQNIDLESYLDEKADLPSLVIQKAIAAYLDKETSRIDALIAKKERQIELLEEKRQAIITRAITKGLDPKAKMEDSGIGWIGEIPQSWDVKRLSFCATFISGGTPDKGNELYWNGEIPWVSPKDMKRRYIDDSIDHLTAEAIEESGLRYVKANMILVVVRGMILAHSFPVAIATRDVTINQDIKALKFDRQFETEYAAYLLMAFEKLIVSQYTDESAHGTKAIRMDNWKDFPVICPSLQEQKQIVDFLSHATIQIDTTIGKIRASCELLREYRSSLITSAVSGKKSVDQEEVR